MTQRSNVQVDLDAIMQGLEQVGYDELPLEFASADADRFGLIDAMNAALNVVNGNVQDAYGEGTLVSVAGGTVTLKRIMTAEGPGEWLNAFAHELDTRGLAGVIRAFPVVPLPRWFYSTPGPRLTVFAAHAGPLFMPSSEESDMRPASVWYDRAIAWAAAVGGDAYASSAGLAETAQADQLARHAHRALHAVHSSSVVFANPSAHRASQVVFNRNGQTTFQLVDRTTAQPTQVDLLRQAILSDPDSTRLAFLAPMPQAAAGWNSRDRALPALPPGAADSLRDNSALWARFVPDAHCMQLLTEEHLDRVSDLADWEVTEVGVRRFLVTARNLEDWLSPSGPSDATVAKARSDFNAVILSPEAE